MPEPSIFEKSQHGQRGLTFPASDVPDQGPVLPLPLLRSRPPRLPQVSERSVVRHITILSKENFSVDGNFYPLGSCTMKYSPRVNEQAAALADFTGMHPYQFDEDGQGTLEILWRLQEMLKEITGLAAVSLQPAAGAQGELTALLVFAAWFRERGEKRTKVLIPDSAHGTNPASAHIAGFTPVEVRSNAAGLVDLDDLGSKLDGAVAGMMLTNPNTLGLFETNVAEIAKLLHGVGAKLYIDGANLNAIMGLTRPGDWGADAMHVNTHKTLATPHGGGGPGAGPICVAADLEAYLPLPVVERGHSGRFALKTSGERSIGRVRGFAGQIGVLLRAYLYLRSLGPAGLRGVAENAVLNARYLQQACAGILEAPYNGNSMHEFVLSARKLKAETGIRALDLAKRLIDHGIHPPTIYFPLVVEEALMIEPTETERRRTLDEFARVLREIVAEARTAPDRLREAPLSTSISRPDEVRAAREPDLRYRWPDGDQAADD
jgi:glycine dehydrogenase subunit 2